MQRDPSKTGSGGSHHLYASGFPPMFQNFSPVARSSAFFIVFFLLCAFVSVLWINDTSMILPATTTKMATVTTTTPPPPPPPQNLRRPIPFSCPTTNLSRPQFCCSSLPHPATPLPSSSSCPNYFRWIHEDLRPWLVTGITQEMVARASRTATFRLVVVDGRAYVVRYRRSFQTRDVFNIWGILQLLRRYPGRIPDLDLMFDCVDWPVVQASLYKRLAKNGTAPPPLFRYCSDEYSYDIVFPDWSFWGWPEINIKPWDDLREEIKEGNKKTKWFDREPFAYWKGNPAVAAIRQDLLKCNVSDKHDWNARLYAQDWGREVQKGFKESDLANQCHHRYKIYIEGSAWSVSEKYILACDSMTLLVTPKYYDFFTRGLMPVQHYWPIKMEDKCRSIKYAVDWGNSHKQKAQAIGREASDFMQEKLKMDYVYDYMFHLLSEYAKLLRYKPRKPSKAIEWCAESMACTEEGRKKTFMMESMVNETHDSSPCSLPPPFSRVELAMMRRRKENNIKQVETWEERSRKGSSS